jgi:ribose/xylose/arabinose/galactoside ABC-type transport system permease subunit/ABC-type sugar transport system substrate-binding protein
MSNTQIKKRKLSISKVLDENRALLMFVCMLFAWTLISPHFMNFANMTALIKGANLNAVVAIGFTIIFILGQLDLSIGAVVVFSGMLMIGLQPALGWTGSIVIAVATGSVIGLINGLLVVKAKINSFIVTLGMMTIVTGLMYLYSGGGSVVITNYEISDWLQTPLFFFLSPSVMITLFFLIIFSIFLNLTPLGRGVFRVAANPETAWVAGLNRDLYLILGFIICSTMAAIGGVIVSIELSSMPASAVLGNSTLMTVLAAVIIGGTIMSGGKGSVLKSYFAVLMLTALRNGMGCCGLGFEKEIFVNGLILASVVLYEAYVIYKHNLLKGQRPDLLMELEESGGSLFIEIEDEDEIEIEQEEYMKQNNNFAIVCVTLAAIVAIVAIFAMYLKNTQNQRPIQVVSARMPTGLHKKQTLKNLKDNDKGDVFSLKSSDGQPLILPGKPKEIPVRPNNIQALSKLDKGHWWDIEFAGWSKNKVDMPESPADGPEGKKVILLKAGDHPYWTAYVNGFNKIAKANGIDTKIYNGNWDVNLQTQQTDQAINDKPDLIIFAPVDATACTPLLRKINTAGIPCIASNTIPCDEAMKYCLAWTGPDDWGQFRKLARKFADKMGKKGGYAIVRHMPGSSPFFARTYAPITELKSYAPDMKLLTMDTANLKAEETMKLVSAWLKKYGKGLKGLILAGDGFTMTGTLEAVKNAGRDDIVIVAAGNSKTGMDSLKAGDALAITYQSAEGDGALALQTAADWFSGKKIPPVRYLPIHIITKDDVENYMPAQW